MMFPIDISTNNNASKDLSIAGSITSSKIASNNVSEARLTNEQSQFWSNYKDNFIRKLEKGSVVVTKDSPLLGPSGAALSEGMGHAMIFAAERADWDTFDSLRAGLRNYFTKTNGLYRWIIQPNGDPVRDEKTSKELNSEASASETEQNVSYALLVAYKKTNNPIYLNEAQTLLGNIWKSEVVSFQDKYLLLPDDITNNIWWPIHSNNEGIIDTVSWSPAYFSPMMYKMFSKYDKSHNWEKLIDDGYSLMSQILQQAKADRKAFGVEGINPMPDWIRLKKDIDKKISFESVYPNPYDPYCPNFSNEYDTVRIPIYVGLDYNDKRAREFLRRFIDATGIRSIGKANILNAQGGRDRSNMAIAAYACGLKAIGRDMIAIIHQINIGRSDHYYQESITYHAWLFLNDRFPK